MGLKAILEDLSHRIIVTDQDFKRLSSLSASFDELEEKLMNALVVDSKEVPHNVITMNSRFVCRMTDRPDEQPDKSCITLVYPLDADIVENRISVLSQVGKAILGHRIGEIVTWKGNDGFPRRMKLERMDYQPEENGDWHL